MPGVVGFFIVKPWLSQQTCAGTEIGYVRSGEPDSGIVGVDAQYLKHQLVPRFIEAIGQL